MFKFVPSHAIAFDNSRFLENGVIGQKQRLLFLCPPSATEVDSRKITEASINNDALREAYLAATDVCPGLEIWSGGFTNQKDKREIALRLPEVQFTGLVLLDGCDPKECFKPLKMALEKRWEMPGSPLDGIAYVAYPHSPYPSKDVRLPALNSEHFCVIPVPSDAKKAVWTARLAALVAKHAFEPARPFSGLRLGLYATSGIGDRFERDALLSEGVSTWSICETGEVQIERLVTTKVKSPSGAADLSLHNLCRRLTLSAIKSDVYQYFSLNFARKMLAADGATGKNILTPSSAKSLLLSRIDKWCELGWTQPNAQLSKETRCTIDAKNRSLLNFHVPVDLMGQLYSTKTCVSFL